MRPVLIALSLLVLAGCATDPQRLGITGPGQFTPPEARPNRLNQGGEGTPGVTMMGTQYGPTPGGPQTGTTGFWGYNQ